MSTCVRYLRPSNFAAGSLREACTRFLAVAELPLSRARFFAGRRQADWRGLPSDGELAGLTTVEPGCRYRVQAQGDSPWSLTIEAWRQRWVLTTTAPTPELAAQAVDEFCRVLGAEQLPCLALALSGGGFRATLFHLGVLRLLADLGKLEDITHICSVSGGSVLAAHLAQNWHRYCGGDFDGAAREILDFVRRDVRGRVFRRWIMGVALTPLLALLRTGARWTRTRLLQEEYDRLYRGAMLGELGGDRDPLPAAARPDLFILSTAMKTGDMCAFTARGLQFERRYLGADVEENEEQLIDCSLVPISMAVTASSAFPPAFPPVLVTHEHLRVDPSRFLQSPEYLSDGGVYDNLGIRKVQHLRSHTTYQLAGVLVSDAEAPFVWQVGANYQRFWNRAVRSSDILMKRVADLEYGWALQASDQGGLPILRARISQTLSDTVEALPRELVRAIRQIRTDLDRFHDLEISCLVRHGYLVARHAFSGHGVLTPAQERRLHELTVPWDPLATHRVPTGTAPPENAAPVPTTPGLSSLTPTDIQSNVERLERIQRSVARWASAIFDARDWVTWVTAAALAFYFVLAVGSPAAYVFLTKSNKINEITRKRDALEQLGRSTAEAYNYEDPWSIQFKYFGRADFEKSVDAAIRTLAAGEDEIPPDAPLADAAKAYRRLLANEGLESEGFPAYVSWSKVVVTAEDETPKDDSTPADEAKPHSSPGSPTSGSPVRDLGLMRGRVPKFVFPGGSGEDFVLLEFSGLAEGSSHLPEEIRLEFFQSKFSGASRGDAPVVSRYPITFRCEGATKDYRGEVRHPLLKDNQGKALAIAHVRLWKDDE